MAYEKSDERRKYQKCDNCIFNTRCFWQEVQRMQEEQNIGNDCLIYQDERDLPAAQRTARYEAVADFPPYTMRIRKPG